MGAATDNPKLPFKNKDDAKIKTKEEVLLKHGRWLPQEEVLSPKEILFTPSSSSVLSDGPSKPPMEVG